MTPKTTAFFDGAMTAFTKEAAWPGDSDRINQQFQNYDQNNNHGVFDWAQRMFGGENDPNGGASNALERGSNRWGHVMAGAGAGAAAGTAIAPGVGTVLGGLGGAFLGSALRQSTGGGMGRLFGGDSEYDPNRSWGDVGKELATDTAAGGLIPAAGAAGLAVAPQALPAIGNFASRAAIPAGYGAGLYGLSSFLNPAARELGHVPGQLVRGLGESAPEIERGTRQISDYAMPTARNFWNSAGNAFKGGLNAVADQMGFPGGWRFDNPKALGQPPPPDGQSRNPHYQEGSTQPAPHINNDMWGS